MIEINLPILSQCYVRRMEWYPAVKNPLSPTQRIRGIAEILDQFELIMLDSYGVLCRGTTPIDGAIEVMAEIRRMGKAFCVVSNDTMTNQAVAADRYAARGFDFSSNEVVTSLDITESWLKTLDGKESWAYVAPTVHPSDELLAGMTNLNGLNGVVPAGIDSILFLAGSTWNAEMQANLVESARGRQFNLAVGNPDMGAPNVVDGRIHIYATPGYFADNLVMETGQQAKPQLFGKPGGTIFNYVAERHGITDPSKVLMVGDTLYTDILGGNAMGFKTLLLECGVYRGTDVDAVIAEAGIIPDFIAPHL